MLNRESRSDLVILVLILVFDRRRLESRQILFFGSKHNFPVLLDPLVRRIVLTPPRIHALPPLPPSVVLILIRRVPLPSLPILFLLPSLLTPAPLLLRVGLRCSVVRIIVSLASALRASRRFRLLRLALRCLSVGLDLTEQCQYFRVGLREDLLVISERLLGRWRPNGQSDLLALHPTPARRISRLPDD